MNAETAQVQQNMNPTTKCEFLSNVRKMLLEAHKSGRKAVTFREDFILDVMDYDWLGGRAEVPAVCEELAQETCFTVMAEAKEHYNVVNFVSSRSAPAPL